MANNTITSTSANEAFALYQLQTTGNAPFPALVQQDVVFGPGFGHDTLNVDTATYSSPGGQQNGVPQPYTIRFEAGISPQDIELISLPDQYITQTYNRLSNGWEVRWQLRVKHTADIIDVVDFGLNTHSALNGLVQISFADGTVWTSAQVQAMLATASASVSDIYGSSASELIAGDGFNRKILAGVGDDTLVSGAGSELLDGGAGLNTYRVAAGGGRDTLSNNDGNAGYILEFGAGLSSTDVVSTRSGNDLLLTLASGQSLLLQGFGNANQSAGAGFQRATFADGSTLDAAQLYKSAFQQSSSGHDVLRGLAGADVLSGGAGNDTITGYGAGDTLLGGDGADSLTASDESAMNGGRGNDWLRGTTGTFTFGAGFGQDTLVADLGNTATTIAFTDGINRSDVEFLHPTSDTQTTWDLYVRVKATGDSILLGGALLTDRSQPTGKLTFADGSTLTFQNLLSNYATQITPIALPAGVAISDTAGNNTYTLAASGTVLNLDLTTGSATDKDVLKITGPLRASDVLTASPSGTPNALTLQLGVQGALNLTTPWTNASDRLTLEFDDGSRLSLGTLQQALGRGSPNNERLSMNSVPGTSETYAFGPGSGQDTVYRFMADSADVNQNDRIILSTKDVSFSRYSDTDDVINPVFQSGIQINVNGTNDRLRLGYSSFAAPDAPMVQFADGSTLTVAQVFARIDAAQVTPPISGLTGTFRDERLVGTSGADVFNPGQGNDTIDARTGGSDTLQAWRGDGQDTVLGALEVLRLQGGITLQDLQFDASNQVSVLKNGQTVYSLKADSLGSIQLDDGSVIRMSDVRLPTHVGTVNPDTINGSSGEDFIRALAGDDSITGGKGNDRYEAGAGDDWIVDEGAITGLQTRTHGSGGADTYVYNLGDGHDTITDSSLSTEVDVLQFGSGISLSDITVLERKRPTAVASGTATSSDTSKNYDTLAVLQIKGQGSVSIRTPGVEQGSNVVQASAGNWGIERLQFFDGSFLDKAGIDALLANAAIDQVGLSGNDVLTGGAGNDTLTGEGGNDSLTGGAGNDSLIGGWGNDRIDGGAGADRIIYESGIDTVRADNLDTIELRFLNFSDAKVSLGGGESSSSVTLTFSPDNALVLDHLDVGGAVKVVAFFGETRTGQELLAQASKPVDLTLTGTTKADGLTGKDGNDTLSGLAGNDTLAGGRGNDLLIGGKGSDTYLFNRGDGQDRITENDSTWFVNDLLKVGGATSKQLWFTKDGNNLNISVIGTQDKVTIDGWFLGSANKVEKITASDGKTLTAAKVQTLVNAMASFTPPADGVTTLPASTPASVTKVIASSWA